MNRNAPGTFWSPGVPEAPALQSCVPPSKDLLPCVSSFCPEILAQCLTHDRFSGNVCQIRELLKGGLISEWWVFYHQPYWGCVCGPPHPYQFPVELEVWGQTDTIGQNYQLEKQCYA